MGEIGEEGMMAEESGREVEAARGEEMVAVLAVSLASGWAVEAAMAMVAVEMARAAEVAATMVEHLAAVGMARAAEVAASLEAGWAMAEVEEAAAARKVEESAAAVMVRAVEAGWAMAVTAVVHRKLHLYRRLSNHLQRVRIV